MPWSDGEYGGIQDVESYFMSSRPSPCASCARLARNKEACAEVCRKLEKWQKDENVIPFHFQRLPAKAAGGNGRRVCAECEGRLVSEDGVIYCARCMTVYMRMEEAGSADQVDYLLGQDWTVEQVAKVLRLTVASVLGIARLKGYSFQTYPTDEERCVIVEYALRTSSQRAADAFELHPETVNKYLREAGFGKKERYERLEKIGRRMLGRGMSVAGVGRELGVNRRTVTRWRDKMCT